MSKKIIYLIGLILILFIISSKPTLIPEEKYILLNKLIMNYSNQTIFCLDIDEVYEYKHKNGKISKIRLINVEEYNDQVINKIRKAYVLIEINGKPVELICEPYTFPKVYYGVKIIADSTSRWGNINKTVQFSIWDENESILKNNNLTFPLDNYSLFSHEIQSYNEVVHIAINDGEYNGVQDYHNYGFDLVGYEMKTDIISPIDGTVFSFWKPDGKICSVLIKDNYGILWDLVHFTKVDPKITIGKKIKAGEYIGIFDRKAYWANNISHLHLGVYLSKDYLDAGDMGTRQLNLYPWMLAAYQNKYKQNLYSVARPHQVAVTGEEIMFDGSRCVSFDSEITSYQWILPDGRIINEKKASTAFEKPGVYIAELWIKDNKGNMDVDFCKVKVYKKNNTKTNIPAIIMTCTPNKNIKINDEILFKCWIQTNSSYNHIFIDFGDGTEVKQYKSYSEVKHKYKKSGIYVVKAAANINKKITITQKQKVVVAEK